MWPAYKEWDSLNKPWDEVKKSMIDTIGADTDVGVYELPAKFTKHVTNAYSFAWAYEEGFPYSKFLDKFDNEQYNGQVSLKQNKMSDKLMKMIRMPSFYSDIAELEDIEIFQGNGYKEKPKYEK